MHRPNQAFKSLRHYEYSRKKILSLIYSRGAPLTWYQLNRKLTNAKMHQLLPQLHTALNELVKDDFLEVEPDPLTQYPHYSLSHLGKKFIDMQCEV